MSHFADTTPRPAHGARMEKTEAEKWRLILTRDLRHAPEKVWQALTDPDQIREWAPFEVKGDLTRAGNRVELTWVGTGHVTKATVTRAEPARALEFHDIRWELEANALGTRLTLWHDIGPRYICWGAAGWHICFDILNHLLGGRPIGRIAGADAMRHAEWQRLCAEYATLFSLEPEKNQSFGKPR